MIKHILLIEDNPDISQAISQYFSVKSNGEFQVDAILKGNLSLISHNIEDYSLIILDIMLPDMNGYSICASARNKPPLQYSF